MLQDRNPTLTPPPVACTARLVHTGPGGSSVLELHDHPVTFGRGPEGVDEVLPGARVSRRHFRIEPTERGRHLVVDLASSNGTFVNDRRVSSVVLEPFDRLAAGDHLLVYLDPATSAAKVSELMAMEETGPVWRGKSPLAEQLLSLALQVSERHGQSDLTSALDSILQELLVWTDHARGLFLVDQGEPGAPAWRPLPEHRAGPELGDGRSSELAGDAVRSVLSSGRAERHATELGPETLCIPLESRPGGWNERRRPPAGEVRGALLLAGRETGWEPSCEEEGLLRALARQVAVVIASARLQRQVVTDGLTGLPNRTWLERFLAQALLDARPVGAPVGVILLDVDDFKRVNDRRGHAAGDAVLKHVAARLRCGLRQSDGAGRWGGEEFLVVLPDTDLEGAALVAEKVVGLIGSSAEAASGLVVTVSAGVSAAPTHGHEPRELLARADQALYAAKRQGKNRHRAWEPACQPGGAETVRLSAQSAELAPVQLTPPVAWLDCELLPSIPVHPGSILLGRAPSCGVILPNRAVSRQHGLLHVSPQGEVAYEDCSRHGSWLNGALVSGRTALGPGDRLSIGPYELRLRRGPAQDPLDVTPGIMLGGSIERAHLCSLLLQLEAQGATGMLMVRAEGLVGELFLSDGMPRAAGAGEARDVEAVRLILGLQRGLFSFLPTSTPPPASARRMQLSTSDLLLQACPAAPRADRPEETCPRGGRCRTLPSTEPRPDRLVRLDESTQG